MIGTSDAVIIAKPIKKMNQLVPIVTDRDCSGRLWERIKQEEILHDVRSFKNRKMFILNSKSI